MHDTASKAPPENAPPLLDASDAFTPRHLGPNAAEVAEMVKALGYASLHAVIDAAVPAKIRNERPLALAPGRGEHETLAELRAIAAKNNVFKSYIGQGYHDCITPPVIQRNILENPGWYTAYTPYQAEIAQGRLEALVNFQTMVTDITGLDIANASLLDEATAAAEAMHMAHAACKDSGVRAIFVSRGCHPQTIQVVQTRAEALGIEVLVDDEGAFDFAKTRVFAVLVQYPDTTGEIRDYVDFFSRAHAAGALAICAADPLALTLLRPPGEFGADIAIGSTQRFGVPLGYGGPHAAYIAVTDELKRLMPGRLVGVSKDVHGQPAYRLALQTREQHIRRDKATSNICTAQVLLAVMASMYAVYHGPEGLGRIARRVHALAVVFAEGARRLGLAVKTERFFDTVTVDLGDRRVTEETRHLLGFLTIHKKTTDIPPLAHAAYTAETSAFEFRVLDPRTVSFAFDETSSLEDLPAVWAAMNNGEAHGVDPAQIAASLHGTATDIETRESAFLTHPVFNTHHTETEMLRYIRRLEAKDLSLTTSMIPLGSCTMKLNATSEMLPVSWSEFSRMHPFAPAAHAQGYAEMARQLEGWLAEITGFAAVSLEPNAGSQGEYAGLLVIRAWHRSHGETQRDVCLIPTSAHGTNPASAVMAGMKVVPVACVPDGDIDLADLRAKAEQHKQRLAALMVTYPSTHGVFEETIVEICEIIHAHGGQVYMDGANMNAQVGLTSPGRVGADVCHLNLHKTFCIPHGGGGPGMGPVGVAAHLVKFLPDPERSWKPLARSLRASASERNDVEFVGTPESASGNGTQIGAISAAPLGSASILVIPWMYIRMMGGDGLTQATRLAILNANYIARRLDPYFPVLFKGRNGLVAHECILDLRGFKATTAEDVAKRLIDFGFHAPTLSWPVPGTLMVEPTESESKEELDRFCEAMIAIHAEMTAVEAGTIDKLDNPLKNAPHTALAVTTSEWNHPYSREQAAYPAPWLRAHKFWPAVGRIDNVWGDRNLFCACVPMDDPADEQV